MIKSRRDTYSNINLPIVVEPERHEKKNAPVLSFCSTPGAKGTPG
ncbi:hypothetical protein ACCC88_15900 [Sphingomonas sp. Sphisp140]